MKLTNIIAYDFKCSSERIPRRLILILPHVAQPIHFLIWEHNIKVLVLVPPDLCQSTFLYVLLSFFLASNTEKPRFPYTIIALIRDRKFG